MFIESSLTSPLFRDSGVCFALTDRYGGISQGSYSSLNLGYHVGDITKHVAHNHSRVIQAFKQTFDMEGIDTLYYINQVHGIDSIILDTKYTHKRTLYSTTSQESICLGNGDSIISNIPHTLCLIMVADCNPILLYDRAKHTMALIHAGRAGIFYKILEQTILRMNSICGSKVDDIIIYVGSSIRVCCYEVGKNVVQEAKSMGFSWALEENKLNLIAILQAQCKDMGIKDSQIEISPLCSCCDTRLFSHRRIQLENRQNQELQNHTATSGRFGIVAALKNKNSLEK